MNNNIQTEHFPDYGPLLNEILVRINAARYAMLKSVNKETVLLYWDIGKSVSLKMNFCHHWWQKLDISFDGNGGFAEVLKRELG